MQIGATESWLKAIDDSKYGFLNPAFEANIVQLFDLGHGYLAHHLSCIAQAPRILNGPLDMLTLKGFDIHRVLEPAYAQELADRVKRADKTLRLGNGLEVAEVEQAITAALTPQVHAAINRYFLTEFAVIYFSLTQTKPSAEQAEPDKPDASFFWHCDGGLSKHLKIMVHLNPAEEHDGATDLLDCVTTDVFKKIGYVFCPVDRRLPDLSELAADYDVPFAPVRLRPDAGEAIVFAPANALHKGVNPTRGTRYIMTMLLIPAPSPWPAFFHGNLEFLVKNADASFPKIT